MNDAPALSAALAAGILSFLSPCVLPLIPVYLSFISGESAGALKTGAARRFPLFVRTLLFIAGFTLVFVLLAIIFGGGMRFIGSSAGATIGRVAGIVVILLAINMIADFIPFLRGEWRLPSPRPATATPSAREGQQEIAAPEIRKPFSPVRSILFGMAFGAGWTPCVGPILSSILLYAGQAGNIAHAALLLTLYSAGLGIPFVLAGLFLDRALPVLGVFKRHGDGIRIVSGLLLFAFGVVMLAGSLASLSAVFQRAGYDLQSFSDHAPAWFRPVAEFLSRWFSFRGI